MTFLRKQDLRFYLSRRHSYIKFLCGGGKARFFVSIFLVVSVFESCGFLINLEKSVGTPNEVLEYLGLIVDSRSLSLSLRPEKVAEIIELCRNALKHVSISLREVAKILGNLAWAIKAILFAQAHYRGLQLQFIESNKQFENSLNSSIYLNSESKRDLTWWIDNINRCNGRPMSATEPDLAIFSDASLSGWGRF